MTCGKGDTTAGLSGFTMVAVDQDLCQRSGVPVPAECTGEGVLEMLTMAGMTELRVSMKA